MPGFVFVVDIKKEAIAVKEAKRLGVPVIAIVDTNTDPDPIDFPIPANDDALKSVQIITKAIADAVLDGNLRASAKQQAEAQEAAEAAATKAAERKQVKGKE
jgi:small subunit ribosomal protein S2